jgi:hypothetical protein
MNCSIESSCLGGAGGANVSAGTAVFAFAGVDEVCIAAGCNSAFGAFGFASAAHDAIASDGVSHVVSILS